MEMIYIVSILLFIKKHSCELIFVNKISNDQLLEAAGIYTNIPSDSPRDLVSLFLTNLKFPLQDDKENIFACYRKEQHS